MASSTTPLYFSSLPFEIRHCIWTASLPQEPDRPALYIYGTKEPSSSILPLAGEPRSDPRHDTRSNFIARALHNYVRHNNINNQEYQPPPLEAFISISLPVPLMDISLESRGIAIDWARKRHYLLYSESTAIPSHVLLRRFNPLSDILYIPLSQSANFSLRPWHMPCSGSEGQQRIPRHQRQLTTRYVRIDHIAIPATFLRCRSAVFANLLESNPCPMSIKLVFDCPPELEELNARYGKQGYYVDHVDGNAKHRNAYQQSARFTRWEWKHVSNIASGSKLRNSDWENAPRSWYAQDDDVLMQDEDIERLVYETKARLYGFSIEPGLVQLPFHDVEDESLLDDGLDVDVEPVVAVRM